MKLSEQLAARYLGECVHFTGIQHGTCAAGVKYMSVRDTSQPGMARFPCLSFPGRDRVELCPSLRRYTPDEAELRGQETAAAFDAAVAKMDAGVCVTCDAKIERREQVGRCDYARPCGHRIGQSMNDGDVP